MKSLIRRKPAGISKPAVRHEPGPCLNCNAYLETDDLFCPRCGQKRIEKEDLSFRHLIGDSFFDYFHFDSKFFRTILPLIFKPGWLTLEFMKGKRKSYVEPFKLFLVISLIFFIILPFSGEKSSEQEQPVKEKAVGTAIGKLKANQLKYSIGGLQLSETDRDSIRQEIDSTGIKMYVEKHHAKEPGWIKFILRQAYKIMVSTGQSFVTVLEHTASKMIFVLIPVFALLLKMFYVRRKRLYFEHLIFSLHLHSFFFLFMLMFMLAGFFISLSISWVFLAFLVYGFMALKRYYQQSLRKTLAKVFLITISYLIIGLPVFFFLLLVVALMSY